jgi:DNA-binding MarR family transcriptional regulator
VIISRASLESLAEFRHQLRRFLHFSETAAESHGVQPQQHQLLLQIAGVPEGVLPTISYAAERLCLRHNSAVELSNRCEEAGLLSRIESEFDRRCVALKVTPKGEKVLTALSIDHARELNELAPQLIQTLKRLSKTNGHSKTLRTRRSDAN